MNIFSKNPEKCSHVLELLCLNGALTNCLNSDQWSPLHTAVRKGQEQGVKAILKTNKKLGSKQKEQFELDLVGGAHSWSALHLAAHATQLSIFVDLVRAGADIFLRNQSFQLPRHCAKGNYIMTKNIKLMEQQVIRDHFRVFSLNEYRLLLIGTTEFFQYQNSSLGPEVVSNKMLVNSKQ